MLWVLRLRLRSARDGEKGIALVAVLWVIVALSLLVTQLSSNTRTEAGAVNASLQSKKARAWAEAAYELGLVSLHTYRTADLPIPDGRSHEAEIDGVRLIFRVFDEAGKLDLNMADTDVLKQLVSELAGNTESAEKLGRVIDGRRLTQNRAEPFTSVSELLTIVPMPSSDYRYLSERLTVYSGSNQLNPLTAQAETLAAATRSVFGVVNSYVQAKRDVAVIGDAAKLPALRAPAGVFANRLGPVFTIRGEAQLPTGARAVVERVVVLSDDYGSSGRAAVLEVRE